MDDLLAPQGVRVVSQARGEDFSIIFATLSLQKHGSASPPLP